MISLAALLVIAIIGGIIYATVHASDRTPRPHFAGGSPMTHDHPAQRRAQSAPPPLRAAVDAWEHAGLISHEQAEAIEAFETQFVPSEPDGGSATPRPRRIPLVAEALGYLGGILAIVGLVLLVARYWDDMATAGRLALGGIGALALAGAGYAVHEERDPALQRLRWFLWTLSAAAGGLFSGVLAVNAIGTDNAATIAFTIGGVAAVQNGVLWAWQARPVQQLLALGALAVAVGTGTDVVAGLTPASIATWIIGGVLLTMAWIRLTPLVAITAAVGAVTASIGAAVSIEEWDNWGMLVLFATAVVIVLLTLLPDTHLDALSRILLRVIGGLGIVQVTPVIIGYYAEQAGVLTGAVVWSIGVGLVWIAGAHLVRTPFVAECLGGLLIVGGAAIMGTQSVATATLFGLATAICLIAIGTIPGRVLMSLFGSVGLLVNVPWSINHFFPGEGRAPLLILASGAVIVAVAVWLARMGGRLRSELGRHVR